MKNLRFASGLFLGIFFGMSLLILINCSKNKPIQEKQVLNSLESIKLENNYTANYYKLTIDNIQYIVVENRSDGGVAIIKNQ